MRMDIEQATDAFDQSGFCSGLAPETSFDQMLFDRLAL